MEFLARQKIYYSNLGAIPLRETAEALLSLESVYQQSTSVLEELFPGTKIQRVDVYLNELRSDSLWEDIVVKFIFGSQQRFDAFISSIRERVGMGNIVNNNQLLSAIILGMILAGGVYYLKKDKSTAPSRQETITANNNIIINGSIRISQRDC